MEPVVTDHLDDAAQIAALLDGRLTARQRADLVARIGASEELTADLGEAAGLLLEMEPKRPQQPAAIHHWLGRRSSQLLIAAAILLVAIVPTVYRRSQIASNAGVDYVQTPGIAAELPSGWQSVPWTAPRTRGGPALLTMAARAARAGVLFTDLELQVASGDSTATATAEQIISLLPDAPTTGLVIGLVRELAADARLPERRRPVRVDAARDETGRMLGAERLRTAAVIETARIAALRRDTSFFSQSGKASLAAVQGSPALSVEERDALTRALVDVVSDPARTAERLTSLLAAMGS
jgi:hypothetical protein